MAISDVLFNILELLVIPRHLGRPNCAEGSWRILCRLHGQTTIRRDGARCGAHCPRREREDKGRGAPPLTNRRGDPNIAPSNRTFILLSESAALVSKAA